MGVSARPGAIGPTAERRLRKSYVIERFFGQRKGIFLPHLPTGTVTFLFTDIEGFTRLVQHIGDARSEQAFADYRRLLQDAV
jgi:class 3 adenylate cyclase